VSGEAGDQERIKMKITVTVLTGLLLCARALGSPGEDEMTTTGSATVSEAQQILDRIVALSEGDLQCAREAISMAGKTQDFMIVLKYGRAEARAAYMSRIPKEAAQRNEQRIKDLGDVPEPRIAAAAQSLSALLEPGGLAPYQAMALKRDGKYREAAEKYEEAFRAGKGTREYYYDAACAWARAGDADAAFRDLGKAVDAGWLYAKEMRSDDELGSLHKDRRWNELLERIDQRVQTLLSALPDSIEPRARVKLPAPMLDGSVSVEKALARRRSVRQYASAPLTLQEAAQVLWAAYGITQPIPEGPDFLRGGLRTAPSAGALYPLEIYLVAGNVTDLKPGVYRYESATHELLLIAEGDKRPELHDASAGQPWVKNAPAMLVYSAVYARTTGKYGDRGRERYVCMDAGHSAENVYLECAALGLGTVVLGAFYDADLKLAVGMTKTEEPLYIMPVGKLEDSR
jgi:SagB-type dehydrogenase family enzyme